MSFRAKIDAIPIIQAINARDKFAATLTVTLQNWEQLDAASWWCEERWRDYSLHYRRRVRAEECKATFEFADDCHAIEFLMRFGSRCIDL